MGFIRILPRNTFDCIKRRFVAAAFFDGHGGGISVVDTECIHSGDCTCCDFINTNYARVGTNPKKYHLLDHDLVSNFTVDHGNAALCHCELRGSNDDDTRRILNDYAYGLGIKDFRTCDGNLDRPMRLDDITKDDYSPAV